MSPAATGTGWQLGAIISLGICALYSPTLWDLSRGLWTTDQQGHGPLVLVISLWLMWRQKAAIAALPAAPSTAIAWLLIVLACLLYMVGRSQSIIIFELGSVIPMLAGLVLLFLGVAQLRLLWFALFFMCFMVPLPGGFVDAVTQPMKMAVSYAATQLLYAAGYPISRTGVMLQIGPYQLLVADACAGLQTLFTLESMGLLYLNLVRHVSVFRNVLLFILILPIGFAANVVRVCVLSLITYHWGDAAGQGFLHGFAGLVLFLSALLLIIGTDALLRLGVRTKAAQQAA